MKISVTYLYAILKYGYPHSVEDAFRSLAEIRKLGFRYVEMEGLGARNMRELYGKRAQLTTLLRECGLHVHNFCVVDPSLVSLSREKRRNALDLFRQGAELADSVGAETLHLASYAPPVRYLKDKPYQLSAKGGYRFSNQVRLRLPPHFDWDAVWSALVDSCQACADIAARLGRTVIMEPRVGEVICSVDSMLRLIADVGRPNFRANFDTGHFSAQRENVVLALAKLRGKFANIHLSDNDPAGTEHLPLGEGSIDWWEFFRVLKAMKYDGYLGLDLGDTRPLIPGYRKSVRLIREIASRLRFRVEV